ncbi:MAG: N-acyl homoserine lactonase family protein [Proteobacteria bacterium]|nr:N-acyl homoserine lactonase family protein [Pseudomonadota bacterium]
MKTARQCILLLVVATFLSACVNSPDTEPPLRLYVMDCGSLRFDDVTSFGLTNDETPVREMFVPCYLVDHPDGQLLWDAGLDPAIVGQGDVELQPGALMRYDRSVIDQLADIGYSPADIDLIALSHLHFDHAGAANYFPVARLLIQDTEYRAGFLNYADNPIFNYDYYRELADNPRLILEGDHDVFGDGRVRIMSTPGHTPGHQVLFLDLEETGPLVLSGDLYHFRFSRTHHRVPVFNTSAEQTLESMDRVEAFLAETGATFWIEHDSELAKTLKLAPSFYD